MFQKIFIVFFVLFLLSFDVHANIGLPMIVVVWPIYWLGLVPITLIEWWVMKKELPDYTSKKLMKKVFLANFISTLLGIPFAWLGLVIIQLSVPGGGGFFSGLGGVLPYVLGVTLQAPWLVPYESQFYWMIPVAFIVLLIPFFFVSYRIETLVILHTWRDEKNSFRIKEAVKKANIFSYAFLLVAALITLVIRLILK